MQYSILALSRFVSVLFFVVPVCTIGINFLIAVGCGDRCYPDSSTPCDYPVCYISTTLRESPTRYIGLVGFSLTSILGLFVAYFRIHQMRTVLDSYPNPGYPGYVLKIWNQRSWVAMCIFSFATLVMCGVPLTNGSYSNLVHGISSLVLEAGLMAFLYVQIVAIESYLPLPSQPDDLASAKPYKKKHDVKDTLWWIALVLHALFQTTFKVLGYVPEDSTAQNIVFLVSESLEVIITLFTLGIVGFTNFSVFLKDYENELYLI